MRKLIARALVWAINRLGVNPVEQARLAHGTDAVERGQRWEMFYREQGGLADMIASLRTGYFEAASAIGHRDDKSLYEFVVADRVARELEREILQIVVTGKAEFDRRQMIERENNARILRAL